MGQGRGCLGRTACCPAHKRRLLPRPQQLGTQLLWANLAGQPLHTPACLPACLGSGLSPAPQQAPPPPLAPAACAPPGPAGAAPAAPCAAHHGPCGPLRAQHTGSEESMALVRACTQRSGLVRLCLLHGRSGCLQRARHMQRARPIVHGSLALRCAHRRHSAPASTAAGGKHPPLACCHRPPQQRAAARAPLSSPSLSSRWLSALISRRQSLASAELSDCSTRASRLLASTCGPAGGVRHGAGTLESCCCSRPTGGRVCSVGHSLGSSDLVEAAPPHCPPSCVL